MVKKERMHNSGILITWIIFAIIGGGITGCSKKKAVAPDTTPPRIARVFSFDTTRVLVEFSEAMDSASAADTLNYVITSYETLAVHHVDIDPMRKRCVLMTAHQESTFYDCDIKHIEDASGNRLADTVVSFLGMGMAVDSIAPHLIIYEPANGDSLLGFVYFSVNASDNFAVKRILFYLNDSLVDEDYDFPYYTILDVRSLPEGSEASAYAIAEDFAVNFGYSDTLDLFIAYHPPFPYVVVDTADARIYPENADITADGGKLFYAKIPAWPYDPASYLVELETDTNVVEAKVSLDPALPINYLDVYGNDRVYFTYGSKLSIYDVALEQVTTTIDMGSVTKGIVRDNSDRLYVARFLENDIVVYSLQSHSFIDSIAVSGQPTALAIDTVHHELYVALYEQPSVVIVDALTNTVVDSISITESVFEIEFSPDYGRAYISEIYGHCIAIVETETHTVMNEISPSGISYPKGMALTNDGGYLFVASMLDKVLVINTSDFSVAWDFSIGEVPYGVVMAPSGEMVFVTCSGSDEIYYIGF
jgi:DNA-binding beta-propeller fold protein YncE